MTTRRIYWIAVVIFFLVVVLSRHRESLAPYYSQSEDNVSQEKQKGNNNKDTPYKPPYVNDPPKVDKPYTAPGAGEQQKKPPVPSETGPKQQQTVTKPNTSGQYDTLVIIPSSWTQMQNRQWVRETVFGIKNNLEPCKKYDGRIIYKFYIHGRTTWLKSGIHSAQYMQSQVRDLYGEFMEYNDWHFTNTTITDRHTIWGDALNWTVNTFVPSINVKVNKILIFDSSTIVNLPKLEEKVAKLTAEPQGFIQTWGEKSLPFAAMVSFQVADQILKNREVIKENHNLVDLVTAATLFYTNPAPAFKVGPSSTEGLLWESDIGKVPETTVVVGQVYQQEDWQPLVAKLNIQPTAPCAVDEDRQKNIAILTSSYVYADMCMAEASLPSAENKRIYAAKHGYDFVARGAEFSQEEMRGRRRVWGKVGAIQKVLPHYEWLLWMDMDAVVANMEIDVRDIIQQAQEATLKNSNDISLIVSRPRKDKMLNAGVMLIKNTEWSQRFWSEVQRRKEWYNKSPSYEQGAIWDVMQEPEWTSGVHLFDRDDHTMNSFPRYYEDGDFVIHYAPAGCPAVPVLEALRLIKDGESAKGVGVEKRGPVAVPSKRRLSKKL